MATDSDFTELKTEDTTVLFVNSHVPPDKEVPLDYYRYMEGTSLHTGLYDTRFFRLYKIIYLRDVGDKNLIEASILDWRKVKVKPHCYSALMQLIDSMKSVEEFLQ